MMPDDLQVLLIEDNPGDARLIQIMLRETQVAYQVRHVTTLNAGIAEAKNNDYDVVLTDLSLPDSNGLDAVHILNSQTDLPIIVLTGTTDAQVGLEAVKDGAQDYLVKGEVDANLLQRSINYAIQRHRAEAQAQELVTGQERSRLARELHDSVTQMLFSASVISESALRQWENSNADRTHVLLADLHSLTRGALAEMRVLLLELRPKAFDQVDFVKLVSQLGVANATRNEWEMDINVHAINHVNGERKISLYRIVQEALNNIAKHAQAHHIQIHGIGSSQGYTLTIRDDGQGFEDGNRVPTSLGIGMMQERAYEMGATLVVESAPGQGAMVIVRWQESN